MDIHGTFAKELESRGVCHSFITGSHYDVFTLALAVMPCSH